MWKAVGNSDATTRYPKRSDQWLRSGRVMAQYTMGRMWCLVCIRKCVGGRWTVDGKWKGEAGDVLEAEGLLEMPSWKWQPRVVGGL